MVRFRSALLVLLVEFCLVCSTAYAASRSAYLPYDSTWISGPTSKSVALDTVHQQVFTAWPLLDRVDVLSTTDYHLIRSIHVASPSAVDISPDGTTLAVATNSSHILFFDTGTFAKTNDIVFPGAALGISAFLYTANGNAMIRAEEGLSTGGGITVYWDHLSNSFENVSNAEAAFSSTAYSTTGPLARSGDYTKIMLGDASSGGEVQIIDGNTGQILWDTGIIGFQGYIYGLAANRDASRYAVCVQSPGSVQTLVVLDSSFDEIFQDDLNPCLGMTFSADGTKLYRDVAYNSESYTQVLDMTSFSATYALDYSGTGGSGSPSLWQAADATGMVYGVNSNISAGSVVWIALDTTATTAPQVPATNNQVQIVRVLDDVGSPQGGDTIRILCTGVSGSAAVSIGGTSATNVQLTASGALPGSIYVTAQTPPGAGWADVTVTSNGRSATAQKAFQYAASRSIIPFATSPNYLLYDPQRNRLYASHKDQVEVIDVASQTVLAPLTPVGGKLANSQFAGLSLSPDSNRLYIADFGAGLIHILNLANPGAGSSLDPGKALGLSTPITPGRVFELSNGMLIGTGTSLGISPAPTNLFLVDPASQTGQWVKDASGNPIGALAWNTTNQGENVLLTGQFGNADWGTVGIWSVNSATISAPASESLSYVEATANEDGTIIGVGGSTAGLIDENPEIFDFSPYSIGYINQHFDAPTPYGTASFFLDSTGALLYKAGIYEANGGNCACGAGPDNGGVEIDDMHLFQPAEKVVFPEAFVTSYTPYLDHMLTADPTGSYLFGVTQSGITIMQLYSVPLSIGNVWPTFLYPQSGTSMTVRGTGFVSGAQVSVGGAQAATTYVDPNTLTVTVPRTASGWQDVTVTLPGGATYTAAGILQVIGSQPAPVITGFSPASVTVQSGIPGFDQSADVTVVGSNFEVYDTVEINDQPVASAFLDSGHMQATIPATLTGQAGSVSVTVVSPYTGSSNSLPLSMLNPVPAPQRNAPISFGYGSPINLEIYGTGFVAGSVIQWNGQNLPTYLTGGETTSGLELLTATVSASLTQVSGNAIVTVYNPPPGGGVSAPITATLGLQPIPVYTLFGANSTLIAYYFSIPPSIDFGTQVLSTTTALSLYIQSQGNSGYSVSSVSVSGGQFSTTASTCPALGQNFTCVVPLTFAPTAAGSMSGTLTIADNLPGSPHVVPLTGNAIQTPVPLVSLTDINALDQTITATVQGTAVVGGPQIPATAWIEYGTDQSLATYMQTATSTFTGDGPVTGNLTQLSPNTLYAARIAVQTAGGTGRSAIHLFATSAALPWVTISVAQGASYAATVTAGKTATYSLVVSDGGNGYTGTASFTCTGAPTGAACTVSPAQVLIGLNQSPITVTVTTTAAQATSEREPGPAGSGLTLCWAFAAAILFNRKRLRSLSLLLFSIAMISACVSCGGGSSGSGSGGGTPPVTPTPPGTYYLTVTGTTGSAQNSYGLQLTVQ